ncbi:Uncharacterized protein AXF42_Ash003483 [Apostasia shenzhenica]|uniref:ATPase inhibitor n=1 Tax=Apostasia shenzhenica TaxID=1088818 RepID=A0A2I0BGC4_9ASPA|nr:Uncharacterized protein AXF42_Ash003483 [Apostasia shenzhenica]
MTVKSTLSMVLRLPRSPAAKEAAQSSSRFFSDDKGRVLGEEEKAAENIYIKKMEREKMEKMKQKAEKEKAEAEKEKAEKVIVMKD